MAVTELNAVDPLVVEWPSNVAEDAEYAAVLWSATLLGVPDVLLSFKASVVRELDDNSEFKDIVLLIKACEVAKLDNSNAVLEVFVLDAFVAAAGFVTEFKLEPKGTDQLRAPVS